MTDASPSHLAARAELTLLASLVGAPGADLVIAGEGNLSITTGHGTLLVTPSGSRLVDIVPADFVEIRPDGLAGALDDAIPDADWLELILASRVDASAARPTVEVGLHAVISSLVGEGVVAHTHPTDVLAVLCGGRAREFACLRLFPDHVVMLGEGDALVPYLDPGRELAAGVRDAMLVHRAENGTWPRVVLAENHGIFVIGSSAREAYERSLMVVKAARIFASGQVTGLSPSDVARIAGREDEAYRQSRLAH